MRYIEHRNSEEVGWFEHKIIYIIVRISGSQRDNSMNKNRGTEMDQDQWTHRDWICLNLLCFSSCSAAFIIFLIDCFLASIIANFVTIDCLYAMNYSTIKW